MISVQSKCYSAAFKPRRVVIKPGACCFLIIIFFFLISFFLCSIVSSLLENGDGYSNLHEITDNFIADLNFDDHRLIQHIRKYYLVAPSPRNTPYNLEFPQKKDWSQKGQTPVIAEVLGERRNGFFIEAGAYDGETYSNSLYFEKYLNWTGLLVEPDQANFERLRTKGRKAWLLRGCLHGGQKPKKMSLHGALDLGTLEAYATLQYKIATYLWRTVRTSEVWCFPLESALRAINQTKVDFTILDLEGAELPVLRGTPWKKFGTDLFQIEYMVYNGVWDRDRSQKRRKEMVEFMNEYLPDFEVYAQIFLDIIFVKKDLKKKK